MEAAGCVEEVAGAVWGVGGVVRGQHRSDHVAGATTAWEATSWPRRGAPCLISAVLPVQGGKAQLAPGGVKVMLR